LPANSGQKDWRLPNVRELESLTDDTRDSPAINPAFFPNASSSYYWQSTSYAGNPQYAWLVDFGHGYVPYTFKSDAYHVRCVRGGNSGAGLFVRLMRSGAAVDTYSAFHEAYAVAMDGDVIQSQTVVTPKEDLILSSNIDISLSGGFDSGFASINGFTTLTGSLTISGGTVTVANLIISN
jgi:hypothetical protein